MSNTIFVSIASYRDQQCIKTVKSLYSNAKNPMSIFVGICQQNAIGDPDCLSGVDKTYFNNIRVIRIPDIHAKGPTYARYLCSSLWNGEQYYLQIDSHLLFVKDWDKKLIAMINRLKQQNITKPIISHYPRDISDYHNYDPNSDEKFNLSMICRSSFNENSMIVFDDAQIINTGGKLYENAYIGACLFFCESSFLSEIPFDPNLDYLFFGEEILLSVRFWTHGWRIFTPSENIAFHNWQRNNRPTFWEHRKQSDKPSVDKVKEILNIIESDKEYGEYGLGNDKTLAEYYEFAKIDTKNNTRSGKNFCADTTKISSYTSKMSKSTKKIFWIIWAILICILVCIIIFLILDIYYV